MKNTAPHGVGSSYSWYISMYNSRCLMIYPFLTFHLNSNWCSYPCILPLIFNIAWSFKSFVGRKENHCNLFYHVLGNSMRHVSLSNIAKKVQWDDFFKQSNVVILTEAQGILERNDLEWEICLYDIYSLVASLIITLTFHYTLY